MINLIINPYIRERERNRIGSDRIFGPKSESNSYNQERERRKNQNGVNLVIFFRTI